MGAVAKPNYMPSPVVTIQFSTMYGRQSKRAKECQSDNPGVTWPNGKRCYQGLHPHFVNARFLGWTRSDKGEAAVHDSMDASDGCCGGVLGELNGLGTLGRQRVFQGG